VLKTFHNADQETVEYDGSPISWRVSAYAFVIHNSELLIVKNKLEKLHDIIGGGVEFGETIEEALHREALEEAGARIKMGTLLDAVTGWFYHRNGNYYQTVQLFYTAELVGDLQEPTEKDIEWRRFVSFKEIGNTYKLPIAVESVIHTFYKDRL
jgi:ADP-ribose pyrophosphatase YjhB (NUDIX family)